MKTPTPFIAIFLTSSLLHADCPTPTQPDSRETISVSYAFPSYVGAPCYSGTIITGWIDGDINQAFARWTYADQAQNSTNTGFYFSGAGPFNVIALNVVSPADCGVEPAAQTGGYVCTGTNQNAYITTYFYFGSTSPIGFPNYDQNAGNFHTFIENVMAHEIGHTMGLWDQPVVQGAGCGAQIAGQSVMNLACGTNDNANNLPDPLMIGLPSCDNTSVHF